MSPLAPVDANVKCSSESNSITSCTSRGAHDADNHLPAPQDSLMRLVQKEREQTVKDAVARKRASNMTRKIKESPKSSDHALASNSTDNAPATTFPADENPMAVLPSGHDGRVESKAQKPPHCVLEDSVPHVPSLYQTIGEYTGSDRYSEVWRFDAQTGEWRRFELQRSSLSSSCVSSEVSACGDDKTPAHDNTHENIIASTSRGTPKRWAVSRPELYRLAAMDKATIWPPMISRHTASVVRFGPVLDAEFSSTLRAHEKIDHHTESAILNPRRVKQGCRAPIFGEVSV